MSEFCPNPQMKICRNIVREVFSYAEKEELEGKSVSKFVLHLPKNQQIYTPRRPNRRCRNRPADLSDEVKFRLLLENS